MIEPSHLVKQIIRPVLNDLGLWSTPAERLLLGTACQESGCGRYLVQLGGPALGIFQMEPATHDDCWSNYLAYHPELAAKVRALVINHFGLAEEMTGNLYYAAAMCRIKYLRVAEALPSTLPEQAAYWKAHYNTPAGAGSSSEYIRAWSTFVGANTWI